MLLLTKLSKAKQFNGDSSSKIRVFVSIFLCVCCSLACNAARLSSVRSACFRGNELGTVSINSQPVSYEKGNDGSSGGATRSTGEPSRVESGHKYGNVAQFRLVWPFVF